MTIKGDLDDYAQDVVDAIMKAVDQTKFQPPCQPGERIDKLVITPGAFKDATYNPPPRPRK